MSTKPGLDREEKTRVPDSPLDAIVQDNRRIDRNWKAKQETRRISPEWVKRSSSSIHVRLNAWLNHNAIIYGRFEAAPNFLKLLSG